MALDYETLRYGQFCTACNSYVHQLEVDSEVVNLPAYVVPVLYQKQGSPSNSAFPPAKNKYMQTIENDAHYFNDILTESSKHECPQSMYLDAMQSTSMDVEPLKTDSLSVRSLYRARYLDSSWTDITTDHDYCETSAEFDTAILSLDPSCYNKYDNNGTRDAYTSFSGPDNTYEEFNGQVDYGDFATQNKYTEISDCEYHDNYYNDECNECIEHDCNTYTDSNFNEDEETVVSERVAELGDLNENECEEATRSDKANIEEEEVVEEEAEEEEEHAQEMVTSFPKYTTEGTFKSTFKRKTIGFSNHARLVKIFFTYFFNSLITANVYFYKYFLRYILFL